MKIAICDTSVASDTGRITRCLKQVNAVAKELNFPVEIDRYENSEKLLFHLEDADSAPDVIFLDVHMPADQEDGIEVAQEIRKKGLDMELIFLTDDEKHWPYAFDVDALHYLVRVKTSDTKIKQTFTKAAQRILKRREEYVTFDCAGEVCTIRIQDIRYFAVERHIVTVHYEDDKSFEFYTPIGKIENRLFNKDVGFVRIHKSYLVSMRYIYQCNRRDGIVMKDGTKLPVSRYRYAEVKEMLDKTQQK